jgi:hypothetical protein
MTNVDSILKYTRTEEEDYYGILGCDESATVIIKVKYFVTTTYVFYSWHFVSFRLELIFNHVCYTSLGMKLELPHPLLESTILFADRADYSRV